MSSDTSSPLAIKLAHLNALIYQNKDHGHIRLGTPAQARQWSLHAYHYVRLMADTQGSLTPNEVFQNVESLRKQFLDIKSRYREVDSGTTRMPDRDHGSVKGEQRKELQNRYDAASKYYSKQLSIIKPLYDAACEVEKCTDPILRSLILNALLDPACTMPVQSRVSRLIDLSSEDTTPRDYEIFRLAIESRHEFDRYKHPSKYVEHERTSFRKLAERLSQQGALTITDKNQYVERMVACIETTYFPDITRRYAMETLLPFSSEPDMRMKLVQMTAYSLKQNSNHRDPLESLDRLIAEPTLKPVERAVLRDARFQVESPLLASLLETLGLQIDWQGSMPRLEIFQYPSGHNPCRAYKCPDCQP